MSRITYANKTTLNHISKKTAVELQNLLQELTEGNKVLNTANSSQEQLRSILDALEILDDVLRLQIHEITENDLASIARYMNSFQIRPAIVTFEHQVLRIFTQMTVGRKQYRKYRIAEAIHDALELFQQDHAVKLSYHFEPPVAVFMIRHMHKISRAVSDNDNNEDGAIINEVFSFLGMSDDVTCMRLYSSGVKRVSDDEKEGVEIIVAPLKLAPEIMENELLEDS